MPSNADMAVSPWQYDALLVSPDGKFQARIDDAMEIAMGGPTSGVLLVSNGVGLDSCNPSMVWSDDSKHLAVPQWTYERRQKLVILNLSERTVAYAPGEYSVLQLERFVSGVVYGVDSPIHKPRRVKVHIAEFGG